MLTGNLIPFIGRVITPCDADGVPGMTDEEVAACHFECRAWVFAWFGRATMWAYGDVEPRLIDAANPRQYAPGDVAKGWI